MAIHKYGWENVENEHMMQAIKDIKNDPSILRYPKAGHSYYLVYKGTWIYEKEVRRRAYKLANGKEPVEKTFSGGEEGEKFLRKIKGEYTIINIDKVNKGIHELAQNQDIIRENTLYDEEIIFDVNDDSFFNAKDDFTFCGNPKPKDKLQKIDGHMQYPRKKEVMRNALAHAHYLVPIAYSDAFDYSLDVEENVVSLCSNCHKRIHYGKDAMILIQKLFEDRKEVLKKVGISIELADLFVMYGFERT